MADVRVKFTGKQPIVVNDKTWLEGEVHTINEKLARSLLAFGEALVVLPAVGAEGIDGTNGGDGIDSAEESLPSLSQVGEGAVTEVVEEKPARRKRK